MLFLHRAPEKRVPRAGTAGTRKRLLLAGRSSCTAKKYACICIFILIPPCIWQRSLIAGKMLSWSKGLFLYIYFHSTLYTTKTAPSRQKAPPAQSFLPISILSSPFIRQGRLQTGKKVCRPEQ